MDASAPVSIILLVLATAVGLAVRHALGSRNAVARTAGEKTATAVGIEPAGVRPATPARAERQAPASPAASPRQRLGAARHWAYWLQNLNVRKAAATPYDLLVVDYSRDGTDAKALRPAEVEALQRKSDGSRRLVGCYLSIGEAEDYRTYWQESWHGRDKPSWLRGENKDRAGNYIVDFWDEAWQSLLMGTPEAYLDRILAQGFDAIYLDRVDVYRELRRQRPTAERDMIEFVRTLSAYARRKNPAIAIIMQNAEELLEHKELRDAIDAIAKEDLLYGISHDGKANSKQEVEDSIECLKLAKRAGIPVFVVEYLEDPATQQSAARQLGELGYIVSFAPRDLGSLYDATIAA